MIMSRPDLASIRAQVSLALAEDLGGEMTPDNDITANLIAENKSARASIITREPCVICGIDWVNQAFALVNSAIKLNWMVADGDTVTANTRLVEIEGSARGILTAERTALNFLQTLSATATVTARYVAYLANSNTRILDTRKTLPGLRMAQKYAVACGGGKNHRFGLYDAFLIKENHIAACGSIEQAITTARSLQPGKSVEVEVENLDELEQALAANADIVMLDNFDNKQIQRAVDINSGKSKLEVSGNITEERLQSLSELGVDYISSGALTKHVTAIDLSLRINIDA